MVHQDHVNLLKYGVSPTARVWADFGSGSGAFTLALAELIGPEGIIYSIDKDSRILKEQAIRMQERYPDRDPAKIHYLNADFTHRLDLPALDGIVMANSLHFQKEKLPVLGLIKEYLKPDGRFLLVEYNVDRGNIWVPYPLSFTTWENLARKAGFKQTRLLATRPSSFLGEIYSAESLVDEVASRNLM
jgi:SAM-dependent methyltransferase